MSKYQKVKLIILSVFGLGVLLILNNHSNNGKYVFDNDGAAFLNTRTGNLFYPMSLNRYSIEDFSRYEKEEEDEYDEVGENIGD